MPFSQDELDQAVASLVRTSIRFDYDSLGTRQVGTSFNDIQDAAAGVFVSYPNAPFYVVRLGANRLLEIVQAEADFLVSFAATVRSVGRNVSPVRKLSFLANARTALDALATATGQRASAFLNIEDIPAYKRFDLNTQKFLDLEGKNIKEGGDVVQTPQEALAQVQALAQELRTSHESLLEQVDALRVSIQDFEALNLPERLSQGILQNAHDLLAAQYSELEALEPEERLTKIRQAVLNVLASRAAVRGFGSLSPQGTFLILEGTGGPFASATYPATPASLQSDLLGPYALFEGQDKLSLVLDGVDSLQLQLPGSLVPFLQVVNRGPYEVFATANEFKIRLTGYPDVNVGVSPLSPTLLDPWDLVDVVNTAITTQPLIANLDFLPLKTTQVVNIDITGSANDADFDVPLSSGTWASLGVVVGDRILVKDPTSSQNDAIFEVVSFPVAPAGYDRASTTILRAGALSDETGKIVQAGVDAAVIWTVRVDPAFAQTALDNKWVLRFEDIEDGTLTNLGIYPGSQITARKTSARTIQDFLNINASASIAGVPRLSATATYVELLATLGRTEPTNPSLLVLYAFRGRGDVTVAGTTPTFVLPTLAGELSPGDLLVIREASVGAEVGLVGTVATVVGTTVTATFSSSVSLATDVLVEGGVDPSIYLDGIVRIDTQTLQDGDYSIEEVSGLDVTTGQVVAITADIGGQPFFFPVSVGRFRVDFNTLDTSLSSAIEVNTGSDDASGQFFSSVPKTAVGTTPYFQLPQIPKNLEAGDQLEIHNTALSSPDVVRIVKELLNGTLIELTEPLDVTQAARTFTQSSPVPFGRIRKTVKQNFTEFSAALETWLEGGTNDLLSYFRRLDAVLNALLVSGNPTPGQINDAVFHLQEMLGTLTIDGATSTGKNPLNTIEAAINGYTADIVVPVDSLLSAYDQKGADRAKLLLLQGRFSTFFGLNIDEVSHAGYVQKLIKDVARLDLPVRKVERHTQESVVAEGEIASWDDKDFEYTAEDLDPSEFVDVPAEGDAVLNIPIP